MLPASSITGEGGSIPTTCLLFLCRSCGSRAEARGLRCCAHFSFILHTARGTAPVIIHQICPSGVIYVTGWGRCCYLECEGFPGGAIGAGLLR